MRANRMTAWPSNARLCALAKWDDKKLAVWRKKLVEKGFLKVTERRGFTNIYEFTIDGIGVFMPLGGQQYEEDPPLKSGKVENEPSPKIGVTTLPQNRVTK